MIGREFRVETSEVIGYGGIFDLYFTDKTVNPRKCWNKIADITETANILKVHIRIQRESWNMFHPITKNWLVLRTYFALLPIFEKHRVANIQNDTLRCEKTNLMKIRKQVHFWPVAYSVSYCWHYLCIYFMSKGIDIMFCWPFIPVHSHK